MTQTNRDRSERSNTRTNGNSISNTPQMKLNNPNRELRKQSPTQNPQNTRKPSHSDRTDKASSSRVAITPVTRCPPRPTTTTATIPCRSLLLTRIALYVVIARRCHETHARAIPPIESPRAHHDRPTTTCGVVPFDPPTATMPIHGSDNN